MKRLGLSLLIFIILLFPVLGSANSIYNIYIPSVITESTPTLTPTPFQPTNVGVISEASMCKGKDNYNPNTHLKMILRWKKIEPEEGMYGWDYVDSLFCGYHPEWVQISAAPYWALEDGELSCKLPKGVNKEKFYNFVRLIKKRYPFIKYVEVWNEPELNHNDPDLQNYIGCVDSAAEYGEFVDHLSKYLKQNNITDIKVIAGALSTTYDPKRPNYYKDWIDDMLIELNDNYYGISVHCYPALINGEIDPNICVDKYNYLKGLARHKEIFLSEVGVYFESGTYAEFLDAQVEFFKFMKKYIKTLWFWYTCNFNGWPPIIINNEVYNTDMLGRHEDTKEAYSRPVHFLYLEE